MNDILHRLIKVYRKFCKSREINSDSQMSMMWEENIEVFEDSEELIAIQGEFGIENNEDTAVEIFDMNISEAVIMIENLIITQKSR